MAGGAFSSSGTFGELSIVRIGLVAIHALREHERLFEVSIGMALEALNSRVLAFQWKLRLRMVEVLIQRLRGNLLPPACVVAGLAGLRCEASAVGIFVAVRALIEGNARILRLAVTPRRMALRALYLRVQSRQRITRLGMIELLDVDFFPAVEVVALLAGRTKTSFMSILMTTGACGCEAEIGTAQIFDLDRGPVLRGNMGRIVAFVARQPSVFALQ